MFFAFTVLLKAMRSSLAHTRSNCEYSYLGIFSLLYAEKPKHMWTLALKSCRSLVLPRPKKYLHAQNDENYKQGIHELHDTQTLAEQVCRYDLDDLDTSWLSIANEHFADCGQCHDLIFHYLDQDHCDMVIFIARSAIAARVGDGTYLGGDRSTVLQQYAADDQDGGRTRH